MIEKVYDYILFVKLKNYMFNIIEFIIKRCLLWINIECLFFIKYIKLFNF